MLCPLTVAALVSLILVEVSCMLLEQLEHDRQVSLLSQPQQPQPWGHTDYSIQLQKIPLIQHHGAVNTFGRGLSIDERRERPQFSASMSRQTVDAPPPLPQPSSGGCAGNPDFLNFPGSPSMVFNPGVHVNFVIGVPDDYKMEISEAPDGWKIITIRAPEGSDAITLGPDMGLSPLGANGTFFPNGKVSSQFPFMRPLGSQTGFLTPEMGIAQKSSAQTDQYPDGQFPGSQVPDTGRIGISTGPSGSYPDEQYPRESQVPGSGRIGFPMVPPGSYPDGQYPGSQVPATGRIGRPMGPSGSYPDVQYPESEVPPTGRISRPMGPSVSYPDVQYPESELPATGRVGTPMEPSGSYPDGQNPESEVPPTGRISRPVGPSGSYPDGQYPGSQVPETVRVVGSMEPSANSLHPDGQPPGDYGSPLGWTHPGYRKPGLKTPGVDSYPRQRGLDSRPDSQSPNEIPKPSGSFGPGYEHPGSHKPGMPGRSDMYHDYQYPDSNTIPGTQTPGQMILPRTHGTSGSYPEEEYPDRGSPSRPTAVGYRPGSQEPVEGYPDGKYPDDVSNLPGSLGVSISPRQRVPTDGLHPKGGLAPEYEEPGTRKLFRPVQSSDVYSDGAQPNDMSRPSQSTIPKYNQLSHSPQTGGLMFVKPSGQSSYPDDQYPENTIHPMRQIPGMGTLPSQETSERRFPDGLNRPSGSVPRYNEPDSQSPLQPSEGYQDGIHSSRPLDNILEPGSQTLEMGRLPSPSGQPDTYPDVQLPHDMNLQPGIGRPLMPLAVGTEDLGSPRSTTPGSPEMYRPDDASSALRPGLHEPGSPSTPEKDKLPRPTGQHRSSEYPDGQYPESHYPDFQSPGIRMSPSQHGQPDEQYPGVQRRTPGAPKRINLQQPDQPESFPSGQTPDGLPSPTTEMVLSLSDTVQPQDREHPGMRGYPSRSKIPGVLPIEESPDYVSSVPGSQTPGLRENMTPRIQNVVYYDTRSPLRIVTHGQPGHRSPSSDESSWQSERQPDGSYPQQQSRGLPRGSQFPVAEVPFQESGPLEIHPGGQYRDDVGSHTHPTGSGYKPGHTVPEMQEFTQTSGPTKRLPNNFNRPQGSQLMVTEIPLSPSDSTDIYPGGRYPDDSGGPIHPIGTVYRVGHLVPGMKGFQQPNSASHKYPDDQFPESTRYPPGNQASGPRYQSEPDNPNIVRFSIPSGPQDQIPGRPGLKVGPTPGYKPQLQVHGLLGSDKPSKSLIPGSNVQFPDFMQHLLQPYLTPGNNKQSPSGSSSGPNGSPGGYPYYQYPDGQYPTDGYYPDGHYPDKTVNSPEHTEPQFSYPGSLSPTDMYPIDHGMNIQFPVISRYRKPSYTLPHRAQEPDSDTALNAMDFTEGNQQAPQEEVIPTGRPEIQSAYPGRPYDIQNTRYTDYGSIPWTITHQSQPSTGPQSPGGIQSPENVRHGQEISPGLRMTQPQTLSYITGRGPHNTGNKPTDGHSPPTGTIPNQQIPSMGMITTGNGETPGNGPHSYSRTMNGPQIRAHTVSMGGPQGGQVKTVMMGGTHEGSQPGSMPLNPSGSSMILTYPTSSIQDVGSHGSPMGSGGSVRMIPSAVQTSYQSTPTSITRVYYRTEPSSSTGGSSSIAMKYEDSPRRGHSYSAPMTSYKTIYPGNVQSEGQISYSSPNIQYQKPRQTVVSRWPASRPSYKQSYVLQQQQQEQQQPMNAVRSLDTEQ